MKTILLSACILVASFVQAQYSVKLVVNDVATKKYDDIYVAGNFNNWNPKDDKYKLKPFGGTRKGIVIKDLPAGNYAFKFTRGSMDKVECMADGRDIADRTIDVSADMNLEFSIPGWKDDYPERPKRYSASPQVKIIDTAFKIPQLNRTRRIWVYIPKGYASSSKTYPVLYMQDGQNLFNEQTAAFGEWGVDECLDTLEQKLGKECIVVGIDNGGDKRNNEYSPYDFSDNGKTITAEGKQYVDFLVQTLKPYIDTKYRTKKGHDYTFIAGSSMGGLISFYAITKYPDVFGGAGMFSPSFWVSPQVLATAEQFTTTTTPKLYFYAGGKETSGAINMVNDMNKVADIIAKKNRYTMRRSVNPVGEHKEAAWREEFPVFYAWLMKDVQ